VLLLQPLDLAAEGREPLLVDVPQALLVGVVVVVAQVLDVVLVQGPKDLMVCDVVLDVAILREAELAGGEWLDQLLVEADDRDKPVEHGEKLRPRVGPADRLELGAVDLHRVLQAPHDCRDLILQLTLNLQARVDLCNEEAEYLEEVSCRGVLEQLVVRHLPIAPGPKKLNDVPRTLRGKGLVADGPRVPRVPDCRDSAHRVPHGHADARGVARRAAPGRHGLQGVD